MTTTNDYTAVHHRPTYQAATNPTIEENDALVQLADANSAEVGEKIEVRKQAVIAARATLHGKDAVITAAHLDEEHPLDAAKAKKKSPPLPKPQGRGSLRREMEKEADQGSIIAIIGSVLCLQAKTSSLYWSTLWNQASESMDASLALAKPLADAVTNAADQQAAATTDEANMNEADGWLAISGAGMAVLTGVGESVSDALKEGTDEEEDLAMSKTGADTTLADKTANSTMTNEDTEMQEMNKTEDQAAQSKNLEGRDPTKTSSRLSRLGSTLKGGLKKGLGTYLKIMSKASATAQMSMGLSQGIQGAFVDSSYKSDIASCQKQQGQYDAVSKEIEQITQYYNQNTSRYEDLRGAAQQNLDYAMNIFKSASDTLTQTTNSMFRG